MNYLTLGSCLRDEEHYVQEWLTFHYVQGFERFVLVLHDCADKTEERIRALPFADKINLHKVMNDVKNPQMSALAWIAENYGYTTEWLAILDSDECLFGEVENDFRNVLSQYEEYGGLFAHWLEYGHNNVIERSDRLCIETFTKRQPDSAWINKSGKTVFKPRELLRPYRPKDSYSPLDYSMLSPHFFKTAKPTVFEDGTPLDYKHFWRTEREHSHRVVRCHHYRYRSREDWAQKIVRGNGNDTKLPDYCMSMDEWQKHGDSSAHVFDDSAVRFSDRVKEVLK